MADVDGKGGGGSFWQSTAAMITAIATLIAALVGLAAFLVGQQVFGFGSQEEWTPPSGQPPASPIIIDNRAKSWQSELRVERLMSVDFDGQAPIRNGGKADLFDWGDGEMSSPFGAYVWPLPQLPTATDCASYLATHGTSDYLPVEEGTKLCVRTNEGRTALIVVKQRDGDAWLVDATAWRQRTG